MRHIRDAEKGAWRWGKREIIYLSLHCHHQKDSCIKMGFHVALRPRRRDGLLGTGTEWEGDERVKGSTAETVRKRPEKPWTAARTMEVLRRCPLAVAQRLVH